MSAARAASEAGVGLWEMLDYLRQNNITAQYDMEDFEHDLKVVYSHLERRRAAP